MIVEDQEADLEAGPVIAETTAPPVLTGVLIVNEKDPTNEITMLQDILNTHVTITTTNMIEIATKID